MITIDKVSKHYGSFQVLTDCSRCGRQGRGRGLRPSGRQIHADQVRQWPRNLPVRAPSTVDGISVGDPKTNLPKLRSPGRHGLPALGLFPMSITENLTIAQEKVLGRSKEEARAKGVGLLGTGSA